MNFNLKLLLVAFGVVMLTLGVQVAKIVSKQDLRIPTEEDMSIVRIIRPVPGGGVIYCSGTVISDKLILTAAHCMTPTMFDFAPPTITIHTSADVDIGITAQILSYSQNSDLALLGGDFHTLDHRNTVSGAAAINKAFKEQEILICGYPHNGRFTCSKVKRPTNANFKFSATGWAYPGMSGGPVVDLSTGKVIAVISAVDGDQVILSPLVELSKDLGINVPD